MKRLIIVLAAILLLTTSAYAADLTFGVKTDNPDVPAGGEIVYDVTIVNNQPRSDTIKVFVDELNLFPFSDFALSAKIEPNFFDIAGGASKKVKVSIRTMDTTTESRNYEIPLKAHSVIDSSVKEETLLVMHVTSSKDLIKVTPHLPDELIPGDTNGIAVDFKNNGNILIENAEVYVTSEVFSASKVLTFRPGKDFTEAFDIDLKPDTKPGVYTLSIRIYKDQELKGVYTSDFAVASNPDIKESKNVASGFLRKKITITNENEGNAPIKRRIEYKISGISRFFTKVDPAASYQDGMYVWEFNVGAGEKQVINILIDYRTPFIVLFALALFILLAYYILTRGVNIKKRVFKISHDVEEGITELKIMLHIKNKAGKPVKEIKIIDLIPDHLMLTKEFGTLKPDHMQKGSNNIRLIWNVPSLEIGEERIFSYKVKSKIDIVGSLVLPAAAVHFVNDKGQVVTVKSRNVTIN
ncbi:MAG TPA: hypothetical protein VJB94_04190 [Candidatus Nanoarchaeia archaeon]|nr:hypothetical protein [Candidatus Nanoarchaeia archaeon]